MGFSLKKALGGGGAGAAIGGLVGGGLGALVGYGIGGRVKAPNLPGAPTLKGATLPQYPGFSPEEQQFLRQRQDLAGQFAGTIGQQAGQNQQMQNLFQGLSGLFGPNGQVNQQALDSLRGQIEEYQKGQSGLNTQANTALSGILNPQDEVAALERQRYMNALQGNTPVSQGLQQQKLQAWEQTKQRAAQQGIKISGDSPESAVSQSTAGNQLVRDFNKRYGALEDQERQSAIQYGGAQNLNRLGLVGNIAQGSRSNVNDVYGPQLGFAGAAGQYGPGSLANLYGQAQETYAGLQNPYQQQRLGSFGVSTQQALSDADIANQNALNQYQAALGQQMLNYQNQMSNYQNTMGLLGGVVGLGAQLGTAGLTGGMGGGGAGGARAGGSVAFYPQMMGANQLSAYPGGYGRLPQQSMTSGPNYRAQVM